MVLMICFGNAIEWQTTQLFQFGQNTIINAKVVTLFSENSHGYESVIEVRSNGGEKSIIPQLVRLRLFTPFKLSQGDIVEINVVIKPIFGRLNEAGF